MLLVHPVDGDWCFPPVSRSHCISFSLYTDRPRGKPQILNSQTEFPRSALKPCVAAEEKKDQCSISYRVPTPRFAPPNPHPLLFHVKLPAGFSLRGARFEPSLQAGNTKKWFSDGVTLNVREDGSQTQNNPNGARIETEPDGTWECHGFCARPIRGGGSDKYLEMLKEKRQSTLSLCLALRSSAHVASSCLILPVSCCLSHALIAFCQSYSSISLQVG